MGHVGRTVLLILILAFAAACRPVGAEVGAWPAAGAAGPPPGDHSGKGAVLCAWRLMLAAQAVGRRCFAGQDAAFQAELARSIARTDAFILKNSSARPTPADLARFKARVGEEVDRQRPALCAEDEVYRAFRDAGTAAMRTTTDELLSVPREPVLNPCL
jgi:hypothetical protein